MRGFFENGEGPSSISVTTWREGVKRTEPGSSWWSQAIGWERQWAGTDAQEIPPEHENNFFTVWVTVQWNRLPEEAVESPSLEIVKNHLDAILCHVLLWDGPAWAGSLDHITQCGPFQPGLCVPCRSLPTQNTPCFRRVWGFFLGRLLGVLWRN